MRRVVALLLAGLLALLAGCGDDGAADPPSHPLGTSGLSRALELARGAGRMPMRLDVTTTRPGRGTRSQFDAKGEIDLAARAGKVTLHLEGPPGAQIPDLSITWTSDQARVGGTTLTRADVHDSGGQLGMLPDEVQALAELLADAEGVREMANGSWIFTVPAAAAIRRGIPPQPESGENWSGEARATAHGRLRRVVLRVLTPTLGSTIPAGTAALELTLGS